MAAKPGEIDLESGNNAVLYPGMTEDPKLRWAFIRKVYVILSMQLIITTVATGLFLFYHPIPHTFLDSWKGITLLFGLFAATLTVLWPLHVYRAKHPVNLILLLVFTLVMSVMVAIACQSYEVRTVLMAGILTCAVFVGLTLYTFFAAKRGHDFSFLGPFLFAALLALITFTLIQFLVPFGKLGHMIFAVIGAIVFAAFIIFDTHNLIKRHTYDEYIVAAIALYLDILNLFLNILAAMGGGSGGDN